VENIVSGVFTPVLAKHSKSFSLIDCISVGVDRLQRNFEPMRKQVEAWQRSEFADVTAKVVIYEAFVEGRLEAPKHLARNLHDVYFEPKYEEFRPRTIWSLSKLELVAWIPILVSRPAAFVAMLMGVSPSTVTRHSSLP
jgi:hypothetical protein